MGISERRAWAALPKTVRLPHSRVCRAGGPPLCQREAHPCQSQQLFFFPDTFPCSRNMQGHPGPSLSSPPSRRGEAAPDFTRLVGSREANRANGMHEAFKCHICGLGCQAQAARHNKPVTQALSHWVLYFSSLRSGALCSLATETGMFGPQTCQKLSVFLKQPCGLAKECVSLGAASPRYCLPSSHPSTLEDRRLIPSCLPVLLRIRIFGPGNLCHAH